MMRTANAIVLLALAAACRRDDAVIRTERPSSYALGTPATAAEVAAVDIDANPKGVGLPPGEGTAESGAAVYAQKCAVCHGPKGEGIEKNPRLIGREPAPGFNFASDAKAPKTIGNYWPYATTLYDYIHRTMPLNAPNSLAPSEVYGLVAFLLRENGVSAPQTINATTLASVKMPAQSRFVKDDRTGGATFR